MGGRREVWAQDRDSRNRGEGMGRVAQGHGGGPAVLELQKNSVRAGNEAER